MAASDPTGGRPVDPSRGVLRPLGLAEARITAGFWADRQRVISEGSLDHARAWMDKVGWTGNFTIGAATGPAEHRGREFADSEVYKLIEAMSWETGRRADPARVREIDELVALVGGAQEGDGYLNTAYGRPGQAPRWSDLAWGHELYCAGHLIQAAVAHTRVHGPGPLLDVATKVADHVCATFGEDGSAGVCGHPEIEPALVELYRVTGQRRYLDQAALFVNRRGHQSLPQHQFGWSYFSDDIPVRAATVLRGHAVRALYLAAGVVDVAVETGDDELLRTVAAQFDRTLARRTYLTGGMGSRHMDEAFGDDFVLPSDRAYSESCAGVAAVLVAWRLLLATGEVRYADVIERILYNVVATAIEDDGRAFFYAHTLHQRTPTRSLPDDEEQLGFGGGPRAPWFEVSCCLPNVSRLLASLSTYLAAADDEGLRVLQYADATIDTRLADGRHVAVELTTAYPADGNVTIRVTATDGGEWPLTLRVPAWAEGATVTVDGVTSPASAPAVTVRRAFAVGDEIRLHLPVAPRFTAPDRRIDAVRGCVAVERGPVVYCAESPMDEPVGDLDRLRVDESRTPVDGADGVTVWAGFAASSDAGWPYDRPDGATEDPDLTPIRLLPYHRWARRGPATMRVWLPTVPSPRRRSTDG
ncbi:glycoside hydrolase family 127 protein [Asanoa sp. WMMD1127]|uniref:glycoside hydrolase family 127 protein n=1 Tax=Asanoa sp. WMMD1127 TaxID=3016107 RepID=UPI0024173DC4|nr:beta-L-arabinofuranosidase domain-containing protein [Asanoa sp. WMMD1127]MDG4821773.1 glycoside hydrolase family 127 protein [Asanoa sp. WMMD1127]